MAAAKAGAQSPHRAPAPLRTLTVDEVRPMPPAALRCGLEHEAGCGRPNELRVCSLPQVVQERRSVAGGMSPQRPSLHNLSESGRASPTSSSQLHQLSQSQGVCGGPPSTNPRHVAPYLALFLAHTCTSAPTTWTHSLCAPPALTRADQVRTNVAGLEDVTSKHKQASPFLPAIAAPTRAMQGGGRQAGGPEQMRYSSTGALGLAHVGSLGERPPLSVRWPL